MSTNTRPRRAAPTARIPDEPMLLPEGRIVYLDWLRIGLIVLVVLHHVAMSYGAAGLEFYYVDLPEEFISRNLLVFVLGNQAWFMGALFMIAGYFTPGSYDRKGTRSFLGSRVARLGIPLVVYAAVLNPIAMTAGFSMPDELNPLTPETFEYLDHVRMGPTWFLALLLIFSFGYALWRRLAGAPRADRSEPTAPGLGVIALFVIALAGVSYLLRMQVAVGESWGGFPSLAYLPQYLSFFVLGAMAARRGWLKALPTTTGVVGFLAAAAATVFLFPLAFSGEMFSLELTENVTLAMGDGYRESAIYALWDSTLAVGLCLGLVVLLRAVATRQGAFGRFLARHGYGVYLVHIPIVVYLAVLISDLDVGHTARLMLCALIAVPLSFVAAAIVRKLPRASKVI